MCLLQKTNTNNRTLDPAGKVADDTGCSVQNVSLSTLRGVYNLKILLFIYYSREVDVISSVSNNQNLSNILKSVEFPILLIHNDQ